MSQRVRTFLVAGPVAALVAFSTAGVPVARLASPEWEDPHVVSVNAEPPHSYVSLGHIDSALGEVVLESTEVWQLHGMALVYFAAGNKQQADQALAELIAKYHDTGPFQVAEAYAYRGEADRTFEWLDTAYRLRDGGVSQIFGNPRFSKVVHDPRFPAFLRKLKLAD